MKYKILLITCLLYGFAVNAMAQTVGGTVTDETNGEPLPGVNVFVEGTQIGAVTGADGTFELNVPSLDMTLVFTYIGYERVEVPLDGRTELNIALVSEVIAGEELVVVGYGVEQRVNVIGSISQVQSRDIEASLVSSVSNALQGRLPGAMVQQRSGEPGEDGADILLRGMSTLGDNSPLVIIDGIQGRDMNALNPDNIESVSILKDASAAIYGSRAANGVILITTKQGQRDTGPHFDYKFYAGFDSFTGLQERTNAWQYAQMMRESETYRGFTEENMTFSEEDIEKYRSGNYPWTHPDTDWQVETMKDRAAHTRHDLSVSGGTQNMTYRAAFGSQARDAIYRNSDQRFERYNLDANINAQPADYFSFDVSVRGVLEDRLRPSISTGAIWDVINQNRPTDIARYPNGLPGLSLVGFRQPVMVVTPEAGFDESKRHIIDTRLSADFEVPGVDGLMLTGWFAYDIDLEDRRRMQKPYTIYSFDESGYLNSGNDGSQEGSEFLTAVVDGQTAEPQVTRWASRGRAKNFNFRVHYETNVRNLHQISTFVAYESYVLDYAGFNAFRRYFISDQLPYLFAGGEAEQSSGENVSTDAAQNMFGRFSYNYDQKYFLQFSLRRDGSVRFSEDAGRWGTFPAVLAGWTLSNERFWQENIDFINHFKLRASWAKMGNDLVPAFQYLRTYGFSTGAVMGGNYISGLSETGTPNPNITWEVANTVNLGFESELFNSRVIFETDLFFERREDILVRRQASVPQFTGLSLPDENFGIVENKGVELVFGYRSDIRRDLTFNVEANWAYARNSIVEFDEPEEAVPWQRLTGRPMGSHLLYESAGIFRDEDHVNSLPHVEGAIPGDVIIVDQNGDGEITADDRIYFERSDQPRMQYGISFTVNYRNWGLSGLASGAAKGMRLMLGSQVGEAGNYYMHNFENRWTPDNRVTGTPRAFSSTRPYWRGSHRTELEYKMIDYLRMRNLQLSYTIPETVLTRLGMRSVRLFATGENLFMIFDTPGIHDPEFSGGGSSPKLRYPLNRTVAVGAHISF